jgi:transcriptional regulator with XRE-family HTH domain
MNLTCKSFGGTVTNPSASRRQEVLALLNQMLISPSEFCFRWSLDYEELADLCGVSKSTTYHWLGGQASRREAGETYQRLMALADVILENASRLEPLLHRWLNRRQVNINS